MSSSKAYFTFRNYLPRDYLHNHDSYEIASFSSYEEMRKYHNGLNNNTLLREFKSDEINSKLHDLDLFNFIIKKYTYVNLNYVSLVLDDDDIIITHFKSANTGKMLWLTAKRLPDNKQLFETALADKRTN